MPIVDGWGRGTWGEGAWNENIPVNITGEILTTSINSVSVEIIYPADVTGESLTLFQNSVSVTANANAVIFDPDDSLRIATDIQSVLINASANVNLTGEQINLSLNSVFSFTDVNFILNSQEINLSLNSVSIDVGEIVLVTGENLNSILVGVDADPDAFASGTQVSLFLGNPTITGTGNLDLTSESLTLNLNSVSITVLVGPIVTGEVLNTTLNSVNISIDINTLLTTQLLNTILLFNIEGTLHSSMNETDTTAFVNDISLFENILSEGEARIQNEFVSYTSKSIVDTNVFSLNNLTRGIKGSVASFHAIAAPIFMPDALTVNIDVNVNISGQNLTGNLGVLNFSIDGSVLLTSENLTLTENNVSIQLNTPVNITGENLNLDVGTLTFEISGSVLLSGQELTSELNSIQSGIGSTVLLTGENLNSSLDNENITIDFTYLVNNNDLEGQISLNNVTVTIGQQVNVTGLALTGVVGQVYVGAWTPVITGTPITWTEIAA